MTDMDKEVVAEHLESFGTAIGELFNDTINKVKWLEVDDELRNIRDRVYFMIIDLIESLELMEGIYVKDFDPMADD